MKSELDEIFDRIRAELRWLKCLAALSMAGVFVLLIVAYAPGEIGAGLLFEHVAAHCTRN